MKFPRVARLDDTDEHVYELAAQVGEPAVPGSFVYTFSDEDPVNLEGKRKQAFRHGFLGVESFGVATVVTVAEMSKQEYKSVIERLAHHFVDAYGAPDLESALPFAREEAEYAVSLCEHEVNTLLALERAVDEEGIHEAFKVVKPQANWQGTEVKIWKIEEEG
ncbi:hypothetical protein J2T57_000703 [Natronocella acetinitrilica]|uniref:Uncharacterized protein n=1 Tax=Natronocella acetinitrilica TaxID=414046 RepID=A0AAE3G225_9GAMM|nr:DUF6505 family protein [Natronocella acetinitrilica]MCP1673604.1 hypothetical protein [Natronocella acetinitrilica]